MPRIVELITRRSEQVAASASLGEVAGLMMQARISSVIVVDQGAPLGIVTESDMLRLTRRHQAPTTPVGAVMTRPVHGVAADVEYRAAFRDAASLGIRHIVVTGDDGQALGIVSEADFRQHLGAEFFHHMNSVDTLMDRQFPRLPANASLDEALAAMEAVRGSCAVVVDGRQALGIVTERDVVRLFLQGEANPPLATAMTSPVLSVGQDCLVVEAARLMQERNIRHLVVVDAAGHLAGLLSEHALMRPLNLELIDSSVAVSTRSERYQQALLDNFPHLVWLKDTESRILAANRIYAQACGLSSPEQLIGRTDDDLWPPELAARYRGDDQAVMNERQKKVIVEPILRPEGLIWHETYKAPVIGQNGTLLGTVGIAQDISDRRRSEEAILLRNAALAGLIRNEPLIGVLELLVLSVECEMPGWTCSLQLLDEERQELRPFAGPRLPEKFVAAVGPIPVADQSIACGQAAWLCQRVITDDLAHAPAWAAHRTAAQSAGFAACCAEPVVGPQGQLLGTFAAYGERPGRPGLEQLALLTQSCQLAALILTHQRGAEQLQQSLDTFRGIFDSISEALFIQAADGRFLDANSGAEQIFGYPRATLLGLDHGELGAPGLNDLPSVDRLIAAALAGTPQCFEYWCRNAASQVFPVEVRLHPCRYFGRPTLIASVIDISERHEAARRLEIEHDLAQALAAGLQRSEVLDTILQAALRFPELDTGCIYQREADGAYRLVAERGMSAAFIAESACLAADSPQAAGIRQGRLICTCREPGSHCSHGEPTFADRLQDEDLGCLTVLPVLVGGEAVACLYLGGRIARQISPATLQALETLTSNFGLTLLRLNAQEEANRLQHNLSGLFNTLTDYIIVVDRAGCVLHYNRAVADRLGYGPQGLRGRHVTTLHPPENQAEAARYLAEVLAGQRQDCPLPLQHADGSRIGVDSRIIGGYWDGQPAMFYVAQDIREQLIAEERQKLAASVFDNAHEGIMITDPHGRIVEVNGTFSELTGYARAEAIGQTADLLKSGHHDSAFYHAMWQTIADQGYWRGEVWNRKKSGEIFVELLTISTVRNREGAVSHYVGIFSDITVIKEHQQRLEHLAHFDALTQLPNRMLLGDRMQLAMAHTERSGKTLAVCYLDLDGFKPVNDRYGHAIGDKLLIDVAHRLKACVRAGDTVSRLGGDEFVLLFSDLEDVHECDHAIARVINRLTAPFRVAGHEIAISASIGVTLYPQDGSDSDTLLRHADQAMYAAKQAGRNRYHLFDPENDRRARVRREEVGRIRQALEHREFVLYYQPKVDMRQGHVIGAEALIRWQHPERGLLPPGDFLPAIEGSELSIALGDWVLQEALRQLAEWHARGLELTISVNIAGNHLQAPGFAERLGELLAARPEAPPRCLELEVLETAALDDIANVATLFAECRHFGVSFSLDDFGTGYSSLTYFRRLPADVLKIDQSFVRDMLDDPDDLAIVEGVIGLTQAFQRKVIAEGVETAEHGLVLLQLGCDLAQGYGIARPMPAAQLPDWIRDFRPDQRWQALAAHHGSRDDLPMLIAEIEHRRWLDKLLAYLDDNSGSLLPPPGSPRDCRFGRWYYGPHSQRYRGLPAFVELESVHARLHRIGDELVARRAAGQPGEPSRSELEDAVSAIAICLQRVQAEFAAAQGSKR